jgi:hypothetical protein
MKKLFALSSDKNLPSNQRLLIFICYFSHIVVSKGLIRGEGRSIKSRVTYVPHVACSVFCSGVYRNG